MTTPARFSRGINNTTTTETMNQFIDTDPSKTHVYFNDFDQYAAADWVISTTEAGAGSATEAIADDESNGVLVLTNAGGSGDHDNLQLSKDGGTNDSEVWLFATGKKAWFKTKFKSNDGDKVTIFIGLHITNTDPVAAAPTDGAYFKVTTATGDISMVITKDSVSTTTSGLGTLGDDTFVTLGYYWDGVDTFEIYLNEDKVATATPGTTLPDDELLALSMGVENGEASANTLEVDYLLAAMER